MLESLRERGEIEKHEQPEVFYIDPQKGLKGLQKILKLEKQPRNIEGVDIAHLGGNETVASLVQFLDGLPFKPGYRRFRIRDVEGIDDYASIREVIIRRFRKLRDDGDIFPDVLLIDGGIGQLRKGLEAFELLGIAPPAVVSIAKQEELLHIPGREEPLRLNRRSYSLRLLQYVRDEAHRFAQHYHHLLRRKRQLGD
jgi:excinuclease ABC subunit C